MEPTNLTFEELATWLKHRAVTQNPITYNELASELGLPPVNNLFSNHAFSLFFEQVDADDAEEQRPFRTAVVVQKKTGLPGSGFFRSLELFRGIKISQHEEAEVWRKEIRELVAYYDPHRPQQTLHLNLSHAQNERLKRLCDRTQQTPTGLVEGQMTRLLHWLETDLAKIEEAHRQIENGEFLEHEEVVALFKKRFHKGA